MILVWSLSLLFVLFSFLVTILRILETIQTPNKTIRWLVKDVLLLPCHAQLIALNFDFRTMFGGHLKISVPN